MILFIYFRDKKNQVHCLKIKVQVFEDPKVEIGRCVQKAEVISVVILKN